MNITFGKYKGQTLEQVFKSDPQYLVWVSRNFDEPWRSRVKKFLESHETVTVGNFEVPLQLYIQWKAEYYGDGEEDWEDPDYPTFEAMVEVRLPEYRRSLNGRLDTFYEKWEEHFDSVHEIIRGYQKILEGTTAKFSSDEKRSLFWQCIEEYNQLIGEETKYPKTEKVLRGAFLETVSHFVNEDKKGIGDAEPDHPLSESDREDAIHFIEAFQLQGSEKQVRWARSIMLGKVEAIAEMLQQGQVIPTSAKYWIDRR